MTRRVYLPLDPAALARLADGELVPGPAPQGAPGSFEAYAVTDALVRWFADGHPSDMDAADHEQLEDAAASLAAQASLMLLGADGTARLVAAVDAEDVELDEAQQPGRVRVRGPVSVRDLAAVLADTADAAADVRAAVEDPSEARLEAVGDHHLAWWAPSELAVLVAELGAATGR